MNMTNHITKDDRIFTFNKSSSIPIHFLFYTTSQTSLVFHLIYLESLIVILSNAVLVMPEVSNEGSVFSIFSLIFPDIIDFFHYLIRNSHLYVCIWTFSFISKWFDEISNSLSFIVDSGLFEVINNPLEIMWRDVYFSLFKLSYFLLSAFVHFVFERPTFFNSILDFMICWLDIFYVEIWYYFICSGEEHFGIFEQFSWDF